MLRERYGGQVSSYKCSSSARFKLDRVPNAQRGMFVERLKEEIALVPSRESLETNHVPMAAESEDFFGFTNSGARRCDSDKGAGNELVKYIVDDDMEVSAMLKFPRLCELFLKYNAAVPSSASVKRLFSIAGNVFQRKRRILTDENFEMQLLLKAHKPYT